MNRSLEPHDHPDGAECAGLHDTLLTIIDHNEPLPVLRYCLTVIELVLQHHPTFCTELRYAVGVAQELSMDSDAAEICYAEMIERGDHTASTRARYMTYRYRQLTIRIATCPPGARDYFNARALVASDEVAPLRRLGAVALR